MVGTNLKQASHLKYSGLDGFGACFYQKHWKVARNYVLEAMLGILKGEGMTSSLNSTLVALIL